MNPQEAIAFITTETAPGSKPGLDRIHKLLELINNPQNQLRVLHVAGTNGKGSVSAMLASVLRKAGYRVGCFTSPYLRRITESIRLDGNEIDGESLAALTKALIPYVRQMEDRPSEFELLTAIALLYFLKENCDIVILEAGMGGRQDATNITEDALLSVITNVDLDHVDFLGSTIQDIAFQKAGIIKKERPVIFGGRSTDAEAVIRTQAALLHAPVLQVDFSKLTVTDASLYGCTFDFEDYKNLRVNLAGLYQPYNAAIVLKAIAVLGSCGFNIPETAIRTGLEDAAWPGRFEILSHKPLVLYDGAHNQAGIITAAQSIRHYFGTQKVNLLTGVLRDKDYNAMAALLKDFTAAVYTVSPPNPRALDASELAACFRKLGIKQSISFSSIPEAVTQAIKDSAKSQTPLVVLGSLYMYDEVKKAVISSLPPK